MITLLYMFGLVLLIINTVHLRNMKCICLSQSSQEKGFSQTTGSAEALGVVS